MTHFFPILANLPERIETPRFFLHMPQAGFGKQLYQAIMDGYEDYIKWLNWTPSILTEEAIEIECRRHHAEFILRDFIRYIIVEKLSQEVVGRCAFPSFQANWRIPQFGISYFIRQSKRQRGYATESAHAMSLLAFKVLNAQKVEIYCDDENLPSRRVPEKLNFDLEYTQRGGWPRQDGQLATLHTYALFDANQLPSLEVKW